MARTSKYKTETQTKKTKQWHAALYIRLSREDGDKVESDSVVNQRAMLMQQLAGYENVILHEEYIDDGWSGTSFDRPAFQRMLEDIRRGAVNCVMVKDLSRFGRNYVEVGKYIETVFPLLNVRFISVGECIDSVENPASASNLIVPIKNILNDEYCRDVSNKVRASLTAKRRQGQFIGAFAAYGYIKDPKDHNHLVIDEQAAQTVRDIYHWFLSGMSCIGIARRLNELGIPNPSAYKQQHGMNYRPVTGGRNDGLWPDSSVRRILSSRTYTGDLVQGVNRTKSYKLRKSQAVPCDEWIIVPDAHEPIIDRETFDLVQDMRSRDTRTAPDKQEVYLFSGFLRCADCDRAMNKKIVRQPPKNYEYYVCSTYKKLHEGGCTKHTIRADMLEKAVLVTIQQQIALAVEMDELIADIRSRLDTGRAPRLLEQTIAAKREERRRTEQIKTALYPDWKNGDLTREEYLQYKAGYDARLADLDRELDCLEQRRTESEADIDSDTVFSAFVRRRTVTTLTRELLSELVEHIYVHEGGAITIRFRFADEFLLAAEYIEQHFPPNQSA